MPQFTQEQLEAIQARGENLLVCAAAGSGKTAVLVERIARLVLEGASLENMLVVTFSRAAAAQMRERILARLSQEDADEHVRAQLQLLPRAQIKTLHSFCIWLLRQHFLEADLPPAFSVGAGAAQAAIEKRALGEALDAALEGPDAAELRRVGTVRDLEERIVPALCRLLLCQGDRDEWIAGALESFGEMLRDYPASPIGRAARACHEEILLSAQDSIRRALEISRLPDGPSAYEAVLEGDLEMLASGEIAFARLPPDKLADPLLKKMAQDARSDAKALCESLSLFAPPEGEEAARLAETLPMMEALLRLCQDYLSRAEGYRVASGRLDYTDLERYALRALANPNVRDAVREQFEHVLVDEYQDINAAQEAILQGVSRGNNLFMVGDVKQSIYKFRMADPGIFLRKQGEYSTGQGGRRIDLNRNFRSLPGVLDAVNHIFSLAMNGGSAEILYDERERLYPGREAQESGPPVEVLLLDKGIEREPEEQELADAAAEAQEAARLIEDMIGTPLHCEGGRAANPGDFAILLRAPAQEASLFARALEERGIPSMVDSGDALFATPEIAAFLDLLGAIDNRRRDLPLLGAMRAFGGFSLEELARLRVAGGRRGSFSMAVAEAAKIADELGGKTRDFLDWLLKMRQQSRRAPLPDFLAELLAQTRYARMLALGKNGQARVHNLRAFCAMASRMEGASLGEFLDAVSAAQKTGSAEDTARLPADDQDAVRILSAHKSKGLEFPVVIGARLGKRLNIRDAAEAVLAHNRLGVACKWTDREVLRRRDTCARAVLSRKIRQESVAEEARILYVLLTRAKERLVLLSCCDAAKAAAKWASSGGGLRDVVSLMDMIGPALARHPDGEALREASMGAVSVESHPARYRLTIAAKPAATGEEAAATPVLAALEALLADREPLPQDVRQRLSYRPPQPEGGARKTSVTLRGARPEAPLPPALPAFLQERRDTAAQRGSAAHAVLRALDFSALRELSGDALPDALQQHIRQMADRLLITPRQAQEIDPAALAAFFQSDLGRAALASPRVMREQPFNLRVDEGGAVRLMQGIIDLCFLDESGRWVVVDYKTDRYDLSTEAVLARHGDQVRAYAQAIEALTGMEVSRRAVFLFHTGREVEVD